MLRADRLKAATAYRAAELAGEGDDALVLSLYEAAGAVNGSLGAKAFTKAARRLAKADPVRAREMAERAEQLATDPELASQARAVMASLPEPSDASRGPVKELGLDPGEGILATDRVQVVWCKVTGLEGASLDLLAADGRAARLAPARVELLVAAQLRTLEHGGAERSNGVVVDLVLRARPGDPRMVLRIAGHEMNLPALRPGVPPAQVFAELVAGILAEGGGQALPDTAHAQGRPFAKLDDLAAFELAYYGRPLSDGPPA